MKDLSRHIEYLLCEHNSVAIPGIGVFVTEDLKARYCNEENLYLPPVRSVRLDTENKTDDGKLENNLIQLHRVTRSVAKKWIADYIEDINQSLMDMGTMDMGTMGRLVMTGNRITFEVCDAGVNAPDLYGLDSFHMPKLPVYAHKQATYKDNTHFTIRLRRTTVHRIAAAVAMVVVALTVILPNYGTFNLDGNLQAQWASAESLITLFSANPQPIAHSVGIHPMIVQQEKETADMTPVCDLIPLTEALPVQNNTIATQDSTDMIAEPVVCAAEEQGICTTEEAVVSATEVPMPVANEALPPTQNKTEEQTSTPEVKGYCVVMASAITHKGAEHLIRKLNKEGFCNAVKYMDNGMLRVVLAGYSSEQEARAEIAAVRATDSLYSGSWLKFF